MAPLTLLRTEGLGRDYGGLKAVDHVDFSLTAGQIHAVIGPNGAGKTTFVSLLSGRIAPSRGTVTFLDRDITDMPAHRRVDLGIAYTFQITSIFANLTLFENVALAAQRHAAPHELRARSLEVLDRVGLADRADQVAVNQSYGHQRLLEVAMGLALRPKLLILDEPTQGLSDGEIDNFLGLVRHVARSATVLLIEHNMAVVMALADRITVLDHGSVLAEGTPDEIRADQSVQRAYLGGGDG